MTITNYQRLLKKIDPRLRLRVKGQGDVIGLFVGLSGKGGYITRMSKGELHLNGYRDATKQLGGGISFGQIRKRGRRTVNNLLRQYRWITTPRQMCMLCWGIDYPDHLVRGITGKDQYGPKT